MAAGKGARLASRGFKPLLEINGKSLFQRTLDYFALAEISEIHVAAGCNSVALSEHARALSTSCDLRILGNPKRSGTAAALFALLEYANIDGIVISTVDTVADLGIIQRLLDAIGRMPKRPQAMLTVTNFVHDTKPIWVEHRDGTVLKMSKSIDPTGTVFGNVRWLSKESCTFLLDRGDWGVERDARLMDQLITRFPEEVCSTLEPVVFDIDTPRDLDEAAEWSASDD